jgi:hypothetical protein
MGEARQTKLSPLSRAFIPPCSVRAAAANPLQLPPFTEPLSDQSLHMLQPEP